MDPSFSCLLFQFRSLVISLVDCFLRYESSLVLASCNFRSLNKNMLSLGEKMCNDWVRCPTGALVPCLSRTHLMMEYACMLVHANSPMIIQSPNMVCHVMSCLATIKGIKASGGARIRLPKRESPRLMSNLWLGACWSVLGHGRRPNSCC